MTILLCCCTLALNAGSNSLYSNHSEKTDDAACRWGFLENQGQWPDEILYRASASGFTISFLHDGLIFVSGQELEQEEEYEDHFQGETETDHRTDHDDIYEFVVWKLHFYQGNAHPNVESSQVVAARTNFFFGNDPAKWHHKVPEYAEVIYREVWKGIDVRFRLDASGELKYEFLLAPGADPEQIQVAFEGVNGLDIEADGQLRIDHPREAVYEAAPSAFLAESGEQVGIKYKKLAPSMYGFEVVDIPPADEAWVIDPFVRAWGSFLNVTSLNVLNYGYDVSHDPQGQLVIVGRGDIGVYTSPGVFQQTLGGNLDAYVAKFSPDGSNLVFCTFLGGTDVDEAYAVDVNDNGQIFVCGMTASANFPTTPGAFASGNQFGSKPWLVRLSPDGSNLDYSTFLCPGCTGNAWGLVAVSNDEVIVGGNTLGGNSLFTPTPGAYQTSVNGGSPAFLCRIDGTGSSMVWGTLFGNTGSFFIEDVDVNDLEEPYIVGRTFGGISPNLCPTTPGAFQAPSAAGGFIARFNANASGLVYSSMYGTAGVSLQGISVNPLNREAYAAGFADGLFQNPIQTTPGALQVVSSGDAEAVAFRVNPTGTSLIYSTYLGGSLGDRAYDIAVNADGEAYITGSTASTDFPADNCQTFTGSNGMEDAFVTHLNPQGSGFACGGSRLYGGFSLDYRDPRISLKEDGPRDTLFINLTSHSTNFPTTAGSYSPSKPNSGFDCPTALKLVSTCQSTAIDMQVCDLTGVTLQAPSDAVGFLWSTNSNAPSITINQAGQYWVEYQVGGCSLSDTFNVSLISLPVDLGPDSLFCTNAFPAFNLGTAAGNSWIWSTNATTDTIVVSQPGTYWVTASDTTDGCIGRDTVTFLASPQPIVNLPNQILLCTGESILLDADPGNLYPGATYLWSDNATTRQATFSNPGWAWVELTTADGCRTRDSALISVNPHPAIDLGENVLVCDQISYQADAGPGFVSYLWSDNSTGQTAIFGQSGIFSVTVTDANGCSDSDTILLTFGTNPQPDLGPDSLICAGKSVTLRPQGSGQGLGFTWSNGASSPTITVTQSGSYIVTVTELSSGCQGSDTIEIMVAPLPKPLLPSDTVICDTGQVLLNPGLFPSYNWSDGTSLASISVTSPGLYALTVSDDNGCEGTTQSRVRFNTTPTADLGPDMEFCEEEQVVLRIPRVTGHSIRWSEGGSGGSLLINQSGEYHVEISNECGSGRDTIQVVFLRENSGPFLPNAFHPGSEIPENAIFKATGEQVEGFQLTVYDRWGALIFQTRTIQDGWDGTIDGKDAPEGVYVYVMQLRACDGQLVTRRGTVTLLR